MKRLLLVVCIAVCGLGLLSCKSSKSLQSTPAVRAMTEGEAPFALPEAQEFEGLDARITEDNLLHVKVELPPACKKSGVNVALTWDGRVRKSMPPIATLHFVHEQLDACDGERSIHEYYFDLSPLDKFRSADKPVIVFLPEFNARLAYPKQPTH